MLSIIIDYIFNVNFIIETLLEFIKFQYCFNIEIDIQPSFEKK